MLFDRKEIRGRKSHDNVLLDGLSRQIWPGTSRAGHKDTDRVEVELTQKNVSPESKRFWIFKEIYP